MVALGGWGVCMVAPGGVCMVTPRGACVVALGGAWLLGGGRVWDTTRYGDTVNERAVRILLECISVKYSFQNDSVLIEIALVFSL